MLRLLRRAASLLAAAALAGGCAGNPCTQPLELCSGTCVDLRSDVLHCGGCGVACGGGQTCVDSRCVAEATSGCATRSAGAFVTLAVCGQTVKAWITAPAFVTRAEALAADPASAGASVPRFDLRAGSDCDDQWTWHVDPATAAFLAAPDAVCSACPAQVQAASAYWLADVGTWCPDPAAQGVRVLAVERK